MSTKVTYALRMFVALLLCCTAAASAVSTAAAEERATLTAGPRIFLAEEGSGLWDLVVRRGTQGDGEGPSGKAVDNDGYIYVCDTFGNKILVFTKDGQRHQVLTTEELYHPIKIIADEDRVLHVDAVIAGRGEDIQYTVTRAADGWAFSEKQKAELVPDAAQPDIALSMTAPFGRDGLKYLTATAGYKYQLQLVDKDNNFVKFVPCKMYDKNGRYYKSRYDKNLGKGVITVLDESGTVLGEFEEEREGAGPPVRYRGWVYFRLFKEGGRLCFLRRYSEDGTVEHEIELLGLEEERVLLGPPLMISPNGKYCFHYDGGGKPGLLQLWVQRMTYREEQ